MINEQSMDFNRGWLHGADLFARDVYEGFKGDIPDWIVEIIGGTRKVTKALRNMTKEKTAEDDPWSYEGGIEAGYNEFLEELEEEYERRGEQMPDALLRSMLES
jgi:hypothetical protein